jgi:hypothetical protein
LSYAAPPLPNDGRLALLHSVNAGGSTDLLVSSSLRRGPRSCFNMLVRSPVGVGRADGVRLGCASTAGRPTALAALALAPGEGRVESDAAPVEEDGS